PLNICLLFSFIVGVIIVWYFIYNLLGKKTWLISNGILGGMISSTATTVSYSKKTTDSKSIHKLAAFIITVASAVSFIRILVEIGIVAPTKIGRASCRERVKISVESRGVNKKNK